MAFLFSDSSFCPTCNYNIGAHGGNQTTNIATDVNTVPNPTTLPDSSTNMQSDQTTQQLGMIESIRKRKAHSSRANVR